ncbi:RhoGAP-domain-containing protein [Westerdykella ornata]|uniref:RhoGAP-domain-containing protein n=1 Tax=Westerdykella ornata TaxID=318751 RepID=A0A6A6JJL4_WESOR|nr:RhoGAP-domain-containing protein [Westerdykella ornata]KAF2276323.1 RhoGAP-domain-containing protein [Westerdykella ornata]
MPSASQAALVSRPARNGDPQPAPPTTESSSIKRDLTSWWRQFGKRSTVKKDEEKDRGIFGVPLNTSIPYANVAISLFNDAGESYIYGYVPIVVAKCGVFLKEKATDVEGIFRLAGSEKRIKELKAAFDTPPRFGKGLDWTGYTVHDAANILRRYFNMLPEPIIPLQFYDTFRQPLINHQAEAVGHIDGQDPSIGGFDPDAAVRTYQRLIKELPALNRQLLLYILDLLAVFAAKSDINKMTTSNLASIFQPGIISHPKHEMSPRDYRLNQDILIFLIDNQDHFLIGMEGTAVDEGTVKHIQSRPSAPREATPTTPGRTSGLGRSASAASSAAAESLRKYGGVRRNVSTSSKHSRLSGAIPSPTGSQFGTPTTSGVHRSNTLPSKRSPAIRSTAFQPHEPVSPPPELLRSPVTPAKPPAAPTTTPVTKESDQAVQQPIASEKLDVVKRETGAKESPRPTPTDVPGAYPLPSPDVAPPSSEVITPTAPATNPASQSLIPPALSNQGGGSPLHTPSRERSEFMEGPLDSEAASGASPGRRTFTQILSKVSPSSDEKKEHRKPNKLQKKQRLPSSANPSAHSSTQSLTGAEGPPSPLGHLPVAEQTPATKDVPLAHNHDANSSRHSGATLKPSMSPSASVRTHSTATEYSEAEHGESGPKEEKEERRRFWKGHRRGESKATPSTSQNDVSNSVPGADKSMSSFGSGSRGNRRSLQFDTKETSEASLVQASPDSKEHEKKGGISNWFRHKRAKSPPGDVSEVGGAQPLIQPFGQEAPPRGGKSIEIPRPGPVETDNSHVPEVMTTAPSPDTSAILSAPVNSAGATQPLLEASQPTAKSSEKSSV